MIPDDGVEMTLDEKIDSMYQDIEQIKTMIADVKDQIGPTLDALMRNPMLKMLLK